MDDFWEGGLNALHAAVNKTPRTEREQNIAAIEELYPADCAFEMTAAKGRELLALAKANVNNWRNEPDDVLAEYARLCRQEEKRPIRCPSPEHYQWPE